MHPHESNLNYVQEIQLLYISIGTEHPYLSFEIPNFISITASNQFHIKKYCYNQRWVLSSKATA